MGERIILVDPSVVGQSHLLVNLGFIKLCAKLFGKVEVVAEREHCIHLRAYGALAAGDVALHPYDARDSITPKSLSDIDSTCPVIFLNLEYRLFIRIMSHLFDRNRSVHWVLHSHFAAATDSISSRVKFIARKTLLFKLFPRAEFIVLGDRIERHLSTVLGASAVGKRGKRLKAVIHPIGVDRLGAPAAARNAAAPQREFVRISYASGWHPLPASIKAILLALEQKAVIEPSIRLSILPSTGLRRADGSKVLNSDYLERLRALAGADLTLHLPTDDYSFHASGALLDSFVTSRPLLGLRTDFVEEITSLVGPIGFFFDSGSDLLAFSSSLPEPGRREQLILFSRNLSEGYDLLMSKAERQLREIFESDE